MDAEVNETQKQKLFEGVLKMLFMGAEFVLILRHYTVLKLSKLHPFHAVFINFG